jgi:hypothetical protein
LYGKVYIPQNLKVPEGLGQPFDGNIASFQY